MEYLNISSHMHGCLNPEDRPETIKWILQRLTLRIDEFDAIAVRGMSGALMVSTIADELGKNIILVRRDRFVSHSSLLVEGPRDGRYIILDDLVSSGSTVHHIVHEIHYRHCEHSKCVGIFLYKNQVGFFSPDHHNISFEDYITYLINTCPSIGKHFPNE